MRALLVIACFVAACQAADEWSEFKAKYNKQYANGLEENNRVKIFKENLRKIQEHNARFQKGEVKHSVRMNRFGDLETEEFKAMMNGLKPELRKPSSKVMTRNEKVSLPSSVDWRTSGAVTGVKDQGQCGSCWSFSSTGSLEGQHFLKTGQLVSLSEQQLVDCSGDYGNQGCNGGWMDNAFSYISDNGGIDTESSYPYTAEDGSCQYSASNVGATDTGSVDIAAGSESALQEAVATVGPIAIAIDASNWSFQFYDGGVYDEPNCSPSNLDHGVLAVGYGNEDGSDYWLVKNSWGSGWGLDGYIKMTRNQDNQCGVASAASYPTV